MRRRDQLRWNLVHLHICTDRTSLSQVSSWQVNQDHAQLEGNKGQAGNGNGIKQWQSHVRFNIGICIIIYYIMIVLCLPTDVDTLLGLGPLCNMLIALYLGAMSLRTDQ